MRIHRQAGGLHFFFMIAEKQFGYITAASWRVLRSLSLLNLFHETFPMNYLH